MLTMPRLMAAAMIWDMDRVSCQHIKRGLRMEMGANSLSVGQYV